MEAIHLTYFETPKDDLKIHEIYRNEALLQEMESLSAGRKSLPDASRYYTTPVGFPKRPAVYCLLYRTQCRRQDGLYGQSGRPPDRQAQ